MHFFQVKYVVAFFVHCMDVFGAEYIAIHCSTIDASPSFVAQSKRYSMMIYMRLWRNIVETAQDTG